MKGAVEMQKLIDKYGIAEVVTIKGHPLPVLDIPMMSDEEWQRITRESERQGLRSPKSP